MKGIH
jgi:hypothetical protein